MCPFEIFFFPYLSCSLQIHPCQKVQKAVGADQRGEVDTQKRRLSTFTQSHRLQDWCDPFCCSCCTLGSGGSVRSTPKCSAQKRPCMWVWTQTNALTLLLPNRQWFEHLFVVLFSRCTMRRRTGVRRSTLVAATPPISPQEFSPSLASR